MFQPWSRESIDPQPILPIHIGDHNMSMVNTANTNIAANTGDGCTRNGETLNADKKIYGRRMMEISRKQKRMPLPSCRHSSAKKKRKDGNDNVGHDTRPKARTTSASVQTE